MTIQINQQFHCVSFSSLHISGKPYYPDASSEGSDGKHSAYGEPTGFPKRSGEYSGESSGGFSSISGGYSNEPWDEDCVLTIRKKDICRYVVYIDVYSSSR